jgi:outer membrane lipoprotein
MKIAASSCALVPANSANSRRKRLYQITNSVFVVLLASILTSACAVNQPSPAANGVSVSAITIGQAQQEPNLQLDNDEQTVTSIKSIVRWGGTIARIENQAEQQTMLEIVSRPLSGGGRPIHNDRTDGRFFALVPRFLDPEIIKVGRDVTVLGVLSTLSSGKIGETDYLFPVVQVDDFRYWKKRVAVQPTYFPHGYPYHNPYDDPFWNLHLRKRPVDQNRVK